jgi:hypothetical protein
MSNTSQRVPDEARVAARRARIRARLGAKFDPVPELLVDFFAEPTTLTAGLADDKIDVLLDGEIDMALNGGVDVDQLLRWMEAARASRGEAEEGDDE